MLLRVQAQRTRRVQELPDDDDRRRNRGDLVSGEAMTTNGKLSEEKREEVERKFREVKQ